MRPEPELVLDALAAAGVLTPDQHTSALAALRQIVAAQYGGEGEQPYRA